MSGTFETLASPLVSPPDSNVEVDVEDDTDSAVDDELECSVDELGVDTAFRGRADSGDSGAGRCDGCSRLVVRGASVGELGP